MNVERRFGERLDQLPAKTGTDCFAWALIQEDIFDYIRRFPDGKEEGNETGDIIRKMPEADNR